MVVFEEKVKNLNLDKSEWLPTKLGELADDISKRVDNPSTSAFDRFVGLEQFVSGDLKIKNWGTTANLASSAKAFQAGDILFARRNAYLKRASLVDFDGCCSGDAFVLRENHDKVVPGFLAFLMNSNALWDFANSNAAGTMSKRVKWRDLAEYKFLLPPKGQQAQLAELLWAMDEVIEMKISVFDKLNSSYELIVDDFFDKQKVNWSFKTLSSITKINRQSLKGSHDPNYEFEYLDIAGIVEPKVIGELQKMKFKDAPSRARRITANNSIIISMVRPYHKSFVFLEDSKDIIASTGTAVIEVNSDLNPKFIFHQFFSKRFMKFCEDRMTGTNYPAITPKDIEQFEVLIPNNKEIVKNITEKLEGFEININKIKKSVLVSKSLQKSIINQVF